MACGQQDLVLRVFQVGAAGSKPIPVQSVSCSELKRCTSPKFVSVTRLSRVAHLLTIGCSDGTAVAQLDVEQGTVVLSSMKFASGPPRGHFRWRVP